MRTFIKLAWRNIWRNKRRTLITTASVFFGVILSAFMSSMQEGSYAQYINTVVYSYSGFLQVHKKGYWDDRIINNSFTMDAETGSKIAAVKEITLTAPRLETFALASSEDLTKGVMVMGIDPQKEDEIVRISGKIREGQYLKKGDDGVIIGSGLAKYLNMSVNDTLVLFGQGYHGASAAGKYPVRGIVKHPSPEFDRVMVYIDIGQCQQLFSAQDLLTSLVIMVRNNADVPEAKAGLVTRLGNKYEVMDWYEMNRLLLKQIESDRQSGVIMKGILYLIIGFGILGTVMMMMVERRRELGVVIAVGMRKYKVIATLLLEILFMGMLGVAAGIVASIPVLYYFKFHPIPLGGQAGEMMLQMGFDPAMFFSTEPFIFLNQALTIFILTLIIAIYPVLNVRRLKVMHALRG
jgi:ABC-type lipoprotein release transport system permease subunit